MLQSYVPLLLMTFFICLFIVLMQFLWRYIDDLVGKGLTIDVIGELFFYAALTMVPMALPLAILLASLMIFGNLGEKFELTAMKASGISLLKVMSPNSSGNMNHRERYLTDAIATQRQTMTLLSYA